MPGPSTIDEATTANVAASLTATTLFAAAGGVGTRHVVNETTAGVLYLKYGSAATNTSYTVKIDPLAYFEFPQPCYSGQVTGIWTVADGNARCTEVS